MPASMARSVEEKVNVALQGERMATLKDVVIGTPAGNKAVKKALKKSCKDQLKFLRKARNESTK